MKVALHKVKEDIDYEEEFDLEEDGLKPCSYKGTDLLAHTVKGECIHCDYDKVCLEEKGLHWLDCTEWWDFYDYWFRTYKK